MPITLDRLIENNQLKKSLKNKMIRSQFRSFDFLPYVAKYLFTGNKIQGVKLKLNDVPDAPNAIWWIDNFGNCKTTLLVDDIKQGYQKFDKYNKLPYYARLKDVPDKVSAIIIGSSGFGKHRFLEVVSQGGSAAKILNISVGEEIDFKIK